MEDKQIMALLFERAEQALAELEKHYGARLFRLTLNILTNTQDAEETVNDTYLAVWDAIPPKEPDPLSGYVYKTGRNLALKRLRHDSAAKRNSRYDQSLQELEGSIPGADFWASVSARELGRAIDAFLDTISRENRSIFLRRYWFGDSVWEIARDLSLSEGTVSTRLNRIRSKLKTYLIEEGLYYE